MWYALWMGAHITSNSFSGPASSTDVVQLFEYYLQYQEHYGQLTVVAAGNEVTNLEVSPQYPAAYQNNIILAVASTGETDQL